MPANSDPVPLLSAISPDVQRRLRQVELVATDVDGTLTRGGKLPDTVVTAIDDLSRNGIRVMPVSGRSAGEVLGLCRYLPGVGEGLAENGLVEIVPDKPVRALVDRNDRARLKELGQAIAAEAGTVLELAPDEPFRIVDVAYERAGRADDPEHHHGGRQQQAVRHEHQ